MSQILTLSRGRLADFRACRRRFQLRYLDRLSWPIGPVKDEIEESRKLGQRFHQLLHRHFLTLSVSTDLENDPQLQRWWERFRQQGPPLPSGRRYPEITLTAPIGRHFLTGRFDLLILGTNQAHIFDWKTDSRPSSEPVLRQELQTHLYLALAAEGVAGLGPPVPPEQIKLTYWYVNDPESSIILDYDRARHARNWAGLQDRVSEIDGQLATDETFPLTDDLAECGRCAYQLYCGRQVDTLNLADWEPQPIYPDLEPGLP